MRDIVSKITKMQVKKLSQVIVKEVEHIKNPHEKGGEGKQPSWVGSGYTKLYIWNLTEYEKV